MNRETDSGQKGRFLRIFSESFAFVTLIAVGVIISIAIAVTNETDVIHIDKEFHGLSKSLIGDENKKKTMRLLVIHGIGKHCIGYSDSLIRGIASQMGLSIPEKNYNEMVKKLDRKRESKAKKNVGATGVTKITVNEIQGLEEMNLAWTLLNDHCNPITEFPNYTSNLRSELSEAEGGGKANNTDYNYKENAARSTCSHIRNAREGRNGEINCEEIRLHFNLGGVVHNSEGVIAPFTMGYIRTQSYFKPDDRDKKIPVLKVYELVWDPATSWAKNWYTSHDAEFNHIRERLNKELKINVVNESISDAVMYLGSYRELIQFPILLAYCKVATDFPANDNGVFECPFTDSKNQKAIVDAREPSATNEIAIITHSLGTRIVFDTLGILGQEGFYQSMIEKLKRNGVVFTKYADYSKSADFLRDEFATSLSQVFTLANQVPLLELSELRNPFDFGGGESARQLGKGFNQFLTARKEKTEDPLQVVAFTDPNDLLSYNLKCWYYLHVLRNKDITKEQLEKYLDMGSLNKKRTFFKKMFGESCLPREEPWMTAYNELWKRETSISIVDVSMSLAGWKFPGLYADPGMAHSKYFEKDEDEIVRLIACGANDYKLGECTR
jgi:hypothetical protein